MNHFHPFLQHHKLTVAAYYTVARRIYPLYPAFVSFSPSQFILEFQGLK